MNTYTISEFSKLIRKSIPTLQRCDRKDILIAKRTKTNRRYYTHDQYLEYCGLKIKEIDKKVVVYCRVSSNNE